jgi:hypothetical protein
MDLTEHYSSTGVKIGSRVSTIAVAPLLNSTDLLQAVNLQACSQQQHFPNFYTSGRIRVDM